MAFVYLGTDHDPKPLSFLAGCFRGEGTLADTSLYVSRDGRAELYGETFSMTIRNDKNGGRLILPSRGIVFDQNSPARLIVTSTPSLFLKLSEDGTRLTIPGDPPNAILRRERCPSGRTESQISWRPV